MLMPEEAALITRRYLGLLGIKPGDVDGLRSVDPNQILSAQELLFKDLIHEDPENGLLGQRAGLLHCLLPVANGEVVSALPVELIRRGAGSNVTLLVGSNTDENGLHRLWAGGILSTEYMRSLSCTALERNGSDVRAVEAIYRRRCTDGLATAQAMEGDRMFVLPTMDLARAHAGAGGRTYMYELAYAPTPFGACHVMDVPLVFDNLDTALARTLVGGRAGQRLASLMHTAWVDFARTGNPDPAQALGWAPYEVGRPASFIIDETCRLDTEREARLRELWGWH